MLRDALKCLIQNVAPKALKESFGNENAFQAFAGDVENGYSGGWFSINMRINILYMPELCGIYAEMMLIVWINHRELSEDWWRWKNNDPHLYEQILLITGSKDGDYCFLCCVLLWIFLFVLLFNCFVLRQIHCVSDYYMHFGCLKLKFLENIRVISVYFKVWTSVFV